MSSASNPASRSPLSILTEPRVLGLALVALGLALRCLAMSRSLWYDELFSLVHFIDPGPWVALTKYRAANNHSFYSFLASLCWTCSKQLWVLRLPAFVFATAALLILPWTLCVRWGSRVALLALALLVLSPAHVIYSQEARGYSAMVLGGWLILFSAAGLSQHFADTWPEDAFTLRRDAWTAPPVRAFVLSVLISAWCHPATLLLSLALPLALLSARERAYARAFLAHWLLAHGLVLLVFLPVLKRMSSFARRHILAQQPLTVSERLAEMLRAWSSWQGSLIWPLCLLILAIIGWRRLQCAEDSRLAPYFLAGFAVVVGFWAGPGTLFYKRFVLVLLLPFIVLVALGFDAITRDSHWPHWSVAVFLGLVVAFQGPVIERWNSQPIQDLRGALQTARQRSQRLAASGHGAELMGFYAGEDILIVRNRNDLERARREGRALIEVFALDSPEDWVKILETADSKVLKGLRHDVRVLWWE